MQNECMQIEQSATYVITPGRLRARSGSKLPAARFRTGTLSRIESDEFAPAHRVPKVICGCLAEVVRRASCCWAVAASDLKHAGRRESPNMYCVSARV